MAEFEDYCEGKEIKLYVLPFKSLKMNGYAERANETYKYEFWNLYEIPDNTGKTRILLKKYERKYNCEKCTKVINI